MMPSACSAYERSRGPPSLQSRLASIHSVAHVPVPMPRGDGSDDGGEDRDHALPCASPSAPVALRRCVGSGIARSRGRSARSQQTAQKTRSEAQPQPCLRSQQEPPGEAALGSEGRSGLQEKRFMMWMSKRTRRVWAMRRTDGQSGSIAACSDSAAHTLRAQLPDRVCVRSHVTAVAELGTGQVADVSLDACFPAGPDARNQTGSARPDGAGARSLCRSVGSSQGSHRASQLLAVADDC